MNDDTPQKDHGYLLCRNVPTRGRCGLFQMLYTIALMVDIDVDGGYSYRYCYESVADAVDALATWTGAGDAPGRWIKRKGLGTDLLNPEWSKAA